MAFSKKTWVSANNISAAEMQNIEDGLDDLFNNNMTINGEKTFLKTLWITNCETSTKDLKVEDSSAPTLNGTFYTYSGISLGIQQSGGLSTRILQNGSLGNFVTRLVNDVYPQLHGMRHSPRGSGGGDVVPRATMYIVDPSGKGDFLNLNTAIAATANHDILYVRAGNYSSPVSVYARVIIGEGYTTHITLGDVSNCIINNCKVNINGNIIDTLIYNVFIAGALYILMGTKLINCISLETVNCLNNTDGVIIAGCNFYKIEAAYAHVSNAIYVGNVLEYFIMNGDNNIIADNIISTNVTFGAGSVGNQLTTNVVGSIIDNGANTDDNNIEF